MIIIFKNLDYNVFILLLLNIIDYMNGKENKQLGLIEIRDMLKGEFNKFSDISGSLSQQKEDFGKIKDTLTSLISYNFSV